MVRFKIWALAAGGAVLAFLAMLLKIKRLEKKAVETKLKHAEVAMDLNHKSAEKLTEARKKGQERLDEIRNSSADIDL